LTASPWGSSPPAFWANPFLRQQIPQLLWDAAIAGEWWRCASETPQTIFPERLGHYWVWRDERTDWPRLFRDETEVWRIRLSAASAHAAGARDLGPRLNAAAEAAMISHREQAGRIGIGRSTYFEVKAGRGGKRAQIARPRRVGGSRGQWIRHTSVSSRNKRGQSVRSSRHTQ
jgi:hypothetical protein